MKTNSSVEAGVVRRGPLRSFFVSLSASGQQALIFLVETVRLRYYVSAFIVVVVVCGYLYYLLTPINQGVKVGDVTPETLSLSNAIYFSVVTITSLGYGDIHPIGWSKVIAAFEVLFGLTIIGLMIAKVTSGPLSHHVRQLFDSDAQKKLESFASKFEIIEISLSECMKAFGSFYQRTPGTVPSIGDKERLIAKFRETLIELHAASLRLSNYFVLEASYSRYFSIVSGESIRRVGEASDKMLFVLGQLIISLSAEAKAEVLDGSSRQRITEAISSQRSACRTVHKHCNDLNISSGYERVVDTCKRVLDGYFSTPEIPAPGLPDQQPSDTDIPQSPTT